MDPVTIIDTEYETAILVSSIPLPRLLSGNCLGLGITKNQIPDDGRIILGIKYNAEENSVVIESVM